VSIYERARVASGLAAYARSCAAHRVPLSSDYDRWEALRLRTADLVHRYRKESRNHAKQR